MESAETAESIYAYTPVLKVKKTMKIIKVRRLPLPGEVLVKQGEEVSFDTVVARTFSPGEPFLVRVWNALGVEPDEIEEYMKKKEGDHVEEGECIAGYTAFFGLIKKECNAPSSGFIESVSTITGQVIVRKDPVPIEVKAYVPGKVIEILPKQGAIIEANVAFIQGIFGFGGETHGELTVIVESPKDIISEDMIKDDHKDKIIVGGSRITSEALKKAVEVGVKGAVIGSIMDKDMTDFLGYEIGVAITGEEEVGISLIITEGLGEMTMAKRTFNLLKSFHGYQASISGATQIRAGVIRPEIIIPHDIPQEDGLVDELASGMKVGTLVRIIREPFFGEIGEVSSLPIELQKIETESNVRVLEVTLEDGRRATIPRANVEIIEE